MDYKGVKGKWRVIELNLNDFKQICIASDESESVLLHMYLPEYEITEKIKATSSLIANSYELLTALQTSVNLLKQSTEYDVLESVKIRTDELEEVIRKSLER